MVEKRGISEGVYDMVSQGSGDRGKAEVPASQSPVVKAHTHGHNASWLCRRERAIRLSWRVSSARWAIGSEPIQGDEWGTYGALETFSTRRNAGSPTGREPSGDGVPVVVDGVTPVQGARESRAQGEGGQVI